MNRIKWALHAMLLPAVLLLFVYSYLPMLGVVIAFKDFSIFRGPWGIVNSPWIGLRNYETLIGMGILNVLRNTIVISFLKIATVFGAALAVSILLNEVTKPYIKRTVQTVIYVPHFLSWVIMGGILKVVLSEQGLVNNLLREAGIQSIPFLSSNDWFVHTLIATNVWKEFGFSTVIYLAAISGINPNLYEAAVVDGAGRWQKIVHVTLPGMKPIILLTLILSLQSVLDAGFDQVFNLYSVPTYATGDIIDTFVYRIGFGQAMYHIGTAVGLFKSIVSAIFIMTAYWMASRLANYRIF